MRRTRRKERKSKVQQKGPTEKTKKEKEKKIKSFSIQAFHAATAPAARWYERPPPISPVTFALIHPLSSFLQLLTPPVHFSYLRHGYTLGRRPVFIVAFTGTLLQLARWAGRHVWWRTGGNLTTNKVRRQECGDGVWRTF